MSSFVKVMKKYGLLFLTILLFVVTFVVLWNSDILFDNFFIILIIPFYIVLFIGIVTLLVVTVIFICKYKGYTNFISLAVLVLLVIMIIFFPFRYAKANVDMAMFDDDRMKIVEMVRNEELQEKPGSSMGFVLPDEYKKLSSDGNIVVYRNNENEQVIGFWIYRGMMSSYTQLIYSSGGEELIRRSINIDTEIIELNELRENWYYVKME